MHEALEFQSRNEKELKLTFHQLTISINKMIVRHVLKMIGLANFTTNNNTVRFKLSSNQGKGALSGTLNKRYELIKKTNHNI